MNSDQKKKKEAQMDQLAVQWHDAKKNGEDTADLNVSLLNLFLELYDINFDRLALYQNIFMETLSRHDPAEGSFCHHLSKVISARRNDRRHNARHAPDVSYGNSMDAPVGNDEESGLTLADMIPDDRTTDVDQKLERERFMSELTALILNFYGHMEGRQANDTKFMWFRIFYTEDITCFCKGSSLKLPHERDVFLALRLPYLDFYMTAPCRTCNEIAVTPMKDCCEVMPGHDGDRSEIPLPVPAAVSLNWLAGEGISAGAAARTNQLKSYNAYKKKLLE